MSTLFKTSDQSLATDDNDSSSKISLIYRNISQQDNKIQSDNIDINGCIFVLQCESKSDDSITKLFLSLELKSLPAVYGAIKINYSIKCDDIGYTKRHNDCTLVSNDPNFHISDWYLTVAKENSSKIDDIIELDSFCKNKSLTFDCHIDVLINYDLFGGIFSSTNENIFIKPSSFNKKLVFGFLHEIYNFNYSEIMTTPLSIYEVIYSYYLGFLNNKNSQEIELVWRFDTKQKMALFWNCKHGDVFTSNHFEIKGCVFYVELTPNGWGHQFKEGDCVNWMAVSALPENVGRILTTFEARCGEIDYRQQRTAWLSTPERGKINFTPFSIHVVGSDEPLRIDKLKDLKQFEFTYLIKIDQYGDLK